MRVTRVLFLIFTAFVTFFTQTAIAQGTQCSQLAFQRSMHQLGFANMFADYPGTTTGLIVCIAAASEQQAQADKIATFIACSIGVCLLSSMENCSHVATQTATLAFKMAANEEARQQLGCMD
jgi:hypothetical protein